MQRGIGLWVKRILLGLLLLVAVGLMIGFVVERVVRARVTTNMPQPGERVNVGGHELHFVEQGEGEITVVFESGLDLGGHLPWAAVQDGVSQFAYTVAYDRAGIMWSERGANQKTGQTMAEELQALLENGGMSPPYLLVGHSSAGLTMRSFVEMYPEDVAGVVFVDASHPDQNERMGLEESSYPPLWLIETLFSVGIGRIVLADTYTNSEPDDYINRAANGYSFQSWRGTIEEDLAFGALAAEAKAIQSFGDIPVVVITGSRPERFAGDGAMAEKFATEWEAMQADLLNLSTDSTRVLALESGHYVQLSEPDFGG